MQKKRSNTAEPYLVPKDKIENKFIVFLNFFSSISLNLLIFYTKHISFIIGQTICKLKKRKKEKNEQKPVLCFNCLLLMRQCPAFVCLFVSKHRKSGCAGSFLLFWFSLAGTRLKIHTSQTCLFLSWTDTCYVSHLLHPANNFSYTGTMARDGSAPFFVWARSNICTNSLQFSSTFIKKIEYFTWRCAKHTVAEYKKN